MTQHKQIDVIFDQISDYKRKFYLNMLYKGIIIGVTLILGTFLVFNFIEFFARFNSTIRGILLFLWIAIAIYTLLFLIFKPVIYLLKITDPITNEKAAEEIGRFFPSIKDKLLNTLQLAANPHENALLTASIAQKTQELRLVKFADAVNIKENKKYYKYALIPILLLLFIYIFNPSVFNSTERIINYKKSFAEPAPFQFEILNKNLKAVKNEDFPLNLKLNGNTLPQEVYIVVGDRKFKMNPNNERNYNYSFPKISSEFPFHFEAGGFSSDTYQITLTKRPTIVSFTVDLKYPTYLNKSNETFENIGNLTVPEGTKISWTFKTDETDSLKISFDGNKTSSNVPKSFFSGYKYDKIAKTSTAYELSLKNKNISNTEKIGYAIDVLTDKYPQINMEQIKDTTLYNYIGIGGSISDDYGISNFRFFYRNKSKNGAYKSIKIGFNPNATAQTFFHQVNIRDLGIGQGENLEYYLQLSDNDGTNGPKTTKTGTMTFEMPNNNKFDKEVEKEVDNTEKQFDDLLKKTKAYKNKLSELDNTLKKKNELNFQDKKDIEDLLKKKEDLINEVKDLQNQINKLNEKQNRFEQQDPRLQEKMDMLQKLINDLQKEENSKLLEEIKKLLEQKDNDKAMDKLNELKKNERNLEKNIDRTMKLFQKLQLKQKVDDTVKDLEKLADKQDDLAKKTEENKLSSEELKKEQEKINKEFEEKKKKLDEIEKESKDLKQEIDTQKEDQKNANEEQKNAKDNLEKKDNQGAAKEQKKSSQSMRNIARKMAKSGNGKEMEQLDIDMDAIRAIIENTIKISHDQERIMKIFKGISVSDPRFVPLSQEQLNIANDAKIIEDSLYSLSSRVLQIQSFVTEEVTKMKNNIEESLTLIKDRKTANASVKQQFAMTSMNNLALMLSDTFKEMQGMGSGSGKGKKSKQAMPGLGEQQKGLNQKMEGLGKSGKGGKELSEELAKLAQEQAKLRKALKEAQDQLNGTEGGKKIGNELSELQKLMDKTENDLVNKRIDPNLNKRNKEIETRLLEAEKAIKEQELDPKRKSNTGAFYRNTSPPELEKFKKEKLKQLELIRTTPPNFTPFYKKQTDNYFKKIN